MAGNFWTARNRHLELDAGIEELQRVSCGESLIRLGLLRTLGVEFVPELARAFLLEHPGKNIRFTFQVGSTGALLQALRERKLDLVFASRPSEDANLMSEVVGHQDLVLIVPHGHPLAGKESIDLAEALPYPQIFFSKDAGLRHIIDGLFEKIHAAPQIAYETQEDQVIAGLVAQGFGIAVVPYMQLLTQMDVHIIKITHPIWAREFCMICSSNIYQPPVIQNFREFVLCRTRK